MLTGLASDATLELSICLLLPLGRFQHWQVPPGLSSCFICLRALEIEGK